MGEGYQTINISEMLIQFSSSLTEKELKVLNMRFGMEGITYTLKETAKEFRVTRERIRQIQNQALEKLRECIVRNQ